LFKLDLALASVTTEFVAVLDDDTMLSSEHLPRAIAALDACDLYTGLPQYSADGNLSSRLIAHFVNNNSILTYLPLLDWCGALTINGMFYVMRTGYLRGIGGFQPIVGQLCDDYALARLVIEKGGRIHQGATSQVLHTSLDGPRQYIRQMHRWFLFANILVVDQPMLVQAVLVVFLGLPSLLLWGSFLCLCGGWPGVASLAALFVIRHQIIRSLHRRFLSPVPKFSAVLSIVSELLQPIHLMHASLSRTIVWRSRRIQVGRRGSFTYVASADE
jgi:ceramide glucosyltransferase